MKYSYIPIENSSSNYRKKLSFDQSLGIFVNKFNQFKNYRNEFLNSSSSYYNYNLYNDNNKLLETFLSEDKSTKKTPKLLELKTFPLTNEKNPHYIEIFNNSKSLYEELCNNLITLKSYQQKRIIPKFDEEENIEIDKNIKKLIIVMTNKIKKCEDNIKLLNKYNTFDMSEQEKEMQQNMAINLITNLKEFTNNFRINEQNYMKNFKHFVNQNYNNDENEILDNDINDINNNNILGQTDMDITLRKRDQEINNLLNSLNDLSSIFKDLQNIIQAQGTILDRIDYNIDTAAINVDKANKHLKRADEALKKSCYVKAMSFILIVIFIESILLIFKYF
jgi:syntaxin 16